MLSKEMSGLILKHYQEKFTGEKFIPGKSFIKYAGRVFDEKELMYLVESSLDFWLTEGRFADEFRKKISAYLGVANVMLTNSGSSANLLAFSALTSKKLGEKRLKPGDEVIAVAAGFPQTVTPIIQNGLIPVFVDLDLKTYNININRLKEAISSKTRCIFLAHTLGNPFNLDAVLELCDKHGLWLIEDNCDALGSKYNGRFTGTFGHLATLSFYPAHHITTGEGGAILTNDNKLAQIVRSFRDWGRDCYCDGGKNNSCGHRFAGQYGSLPPGYDHKYVYSEVGYNLKITDMQAAIGCAQMDKVERFCEKRKENFRAYTDIFGKYEKYLVLPEATEKADPSWFSYIISVKNNAPFSRDEFIHYLNNKLIETRNLFAGNIIRQPFFDGIKYRVAGELANTDFIMTNTFFLGTYPGLTGEMMDYIKSTVDLFMEKF